MIPFRTQRLATSVVNRILNAYAGMAPTSQNGEPAAPAPIATGELLDVQLNTPRAPVDAAPDDAKAIALAPLVD